MQVCHASHPPLLHGSLLGGILPVDHRISIRRVRYSSIPVVSSEGVRDVFLAEGTVNGDRFQQFII